MTRERQIQEGPGRVSVINAPQKFLSQLIWAAVQSLASDIHLRVNNHPLLRVDGVIRPAPRFQVLSEADLRLLAKQMMSEVHWNKFLDELQVDFSVGVENLGRLRVNAFYQRDSVAMAMRLIPTRIPQPDTLQLPEVLTELSRLERGLIIVTGGTGTGKSTTIASLINTINQQQKKHIITIEDPIEYLFSDQQCIISQRELGMDVANFSAAMAAALRQDPDVILLGEMRDPVTIDTALTAAETGHMVFSTLHAPTAADAITRLISSFPAAAQPTIRAKLSQNLQAVVAQRLLPKASGNGRVVVCEVMTVTARIRELILNPLKVKEIADEVKKGLLIEGMRSFDQALYDLVRRDEITVDVALAHATSATDLKLRLQGFTQQV
ncbi:MAG TPA: PilT/PilU family type 4a pilus ATPase [Gammaproteobacteria bacterium]|nr:PilT/PilU family type 4a pilus ATPase [Gammaproteobacteria bacterium]